MSESLLLAVGTRKGLWLGRSHDGGAGWEFTGPHHPMTGVYSVLIDTRPAVGGGQVRLLAGVVSEHFGPAVAASDDLGASWGEPVVATVAFPKDTGASVERVWQLQPGPPAEPETVYAGVEPSALFRSGDGGRSFELVRGLWDHPHRPHWEPGFGGMAIHTVLPHPTEPGDVTVAMSTGGVYRTTDDGKTWHASNTGIRAYFLPDNEYPEFGQCVHKIARHPAYPERLFLQNHHGVYRSDDGGATWVSIADGLPSDFGFPIAVHPHRPETVYAFPLTADAMRFPPEGRCRVYRSDDAGGTWAPLGDGLPGGGFWTAVMRDALCLDDAAEPSVYFGTRSGEVYVGREGGAHWTRIAEHLPDVLCVRAATV
ncbi:WD40/YVTN/BNR-like repeat-containing protein [Yinghuangia seranimata]|uniref:WD40/YVTN/BNR-like repeat-containing protein n=1 Tax=Yinghuangia seranimata TaxID=408067 RepID=UPI00248AB8AB|nr:exo-alpha-sialidase [Yinghuangia seranimata]MDI2126607.1 exo-alpha-sialidase [Yinghuangia seranimata]